MSIRQFIVWCCCILALPAGAFALPSQGLSELTSPNKEYSLVLSDTDEKWVYKIAILHSGREVAHYRFQGELISGYWSPSGKYVAINNHYGHRGWYLWIFSLRDGSIVRASDTVRSSEYDRYTDYDGYLPDIPALAKQDILQVYSSYLHDYNFKGYVSIAYGWEAGDRLLVFHELTLVKLQESEHMKIHVYTRLDLQLGKGFATSVVSAKKVKDTASWESKDVPAEVRNTLNLLAPRRVDS